MHGRMSCVKLTRIRGEFFVIVRLDVMTKGSLLAMALLERAQSQGYPLASLAIAVVPNSYLKEMRAMKFPTLGDCVLFGLS